MEVKACFDHFNINVTDLQRSIDFYDKALGLRPCGKIEGPEGAFVIVYLADAETGFRLELTWLKDHPQPYDLGECEFHLCVRVPGDYDTTRAYHKEMGCVCYENHDMGLYFINDPDGYWIEVLPKLIKKCTEVAQQWVDSPLYDKETQAEVKAMIEADDKTPLIDSFYRTLEFGTGGLRGIMGAGTNRMNIYTVGAATQGLSNYLNKNFKDLEQISVVVGHDCRNNSRLFAETSANIFSANGIKVYLFDDMRPTPEMSFAIRHLGCQSGIILTASHNPKEYNGYKAYWDDGAQVLAPHDKGIIEEVNKVSVADIKFEGNPALIEVIGKEIDDIYLAKVKELSIDPACIARQNDLKIVYTPLHGTGMMLIPQALKMWGFENVHTVPEQMVKSGDFPTVQSPNPENGEALTMALNLA